MILLHTLLLVFALAPSMQEMLSEYRLQLKANALYEHRAYSGAETVFRHIAALPEQKSNASASFNLACSLYMQRKYPESATLFALSTKPDSKQPEVRVKAIFNEGNALAMIAVGNNRKTEKQILFRQSLHRFKTILLTDRGIMMQKSIMKLFAVTLMNLRDRSCPPQDSKRRALLHPHPPSSVRIQQNGCWRTPDWRNPH